MRRNTKRGHPLFARCYDVLARLGERGELGQRRRVLLDSAAGLVLDLGAGTGESFKHYGAHSTDGAPVTAVVAVEPDPAMIRRATRRVGEASVPVHLVRARGEALPFGDGVFETVVSTLVLCSVDHPGQTLAELHRVLRPGGHLLFMEHVRASSEPLARWQDRLERPWGVVSGGCHPNRATLEAIRGAGFEAADVERFDLRPGIALVRPHVQGVAVRV
jgi:ubiquinone/menaquinone biosynthesis C-methylase UbiE